MRILLVILAFWALPAQPDENDPCRCARSKATVQRDFGRADVVFKGTVVDLQYVTGPARRSLVGALFRVSGVYKGEPIGTLIVYSDPGMLCSYEFEATKDYLVYAWHEHRLKNKVTTTRCVRTVPLGEAGDDLEKLLELAKKEWLKQ